MHCLNLQNHMQACARAVSILSVLQCSRADIAAACNTAEGMPAQTWLEFAGGQAAKGVPNAHDNAGSVALDHFQISVYMKVVPSKSMHSVVEGPTIAHTATQHSIGSRGTAQRH